MQWFRDQKAIERSLMNRHKSLCNGEATGRQCKHFWQIIYKPDVDNADHLHLGERQTRCLVDTADATELGDGGTMMPHYCTQYAASDNKFDPVAAAYDPLTPEETEELEKAQDEGRTPNIRDRGSLRQPIVRRGFLAWFK